MSGGFIHFELIPHQTRLGASPPTSGCPVDPLTDGRDVARKINNTKRVELALLVVPVVAVNEACFATNQ